MAHKDKTVATDMPHTLERNLSNRHIQLIAISGAIGTGLFMGSGTTIALAGPSIIFVYMIIGFFLFFVMRAMGEILLSNLNYQSFSEFASDLLGPMAGFFTGWTYWFCWIVTGIADVIAIAHYCEFWYPELNRLIPMLLSLALFLFLNVLTVKLFGETEFWFSIIKVVTIIALIVIGFYLVITHYQLPGTAYTASVNNLWNDGGLFPHGLVGFFGGFQIAVFAFVGIELVGTTAAEAKDPTKSLPKAVNSVPVRVILFYVLSLTVIMCVVPWRHFETDTTSPFVALFTYVGLPAAASILNFVVLTSAASSANSGIYSTSRMLFGLAHRRGAPHPLGRLSRNSVPLNALLFSSFCLLGGMIVIHTIPSVIEAFEIVTTISAILFMFIWSMILISYLVYRKKRPEHHRASMFKMPWGIVMSIATLLFFLFILVLLANRPETLKGLIATPIWFFILLIGYIVRHHVLKRT